METGEYWLKPQVKKAKSEQDKLKKVMSLMTRPSIPSLSLSDPGSGMQQLETREQRKVDKEKAYTAPDEKAEAKAGERLRKRKAEQEARAREDESSGPAPKKRKKKRKADGDDEQDD